MATQRAPRPPNPPCMICRHSRSFHSVVAKGKPRPCSAFGCSCENLVLEESE